VGNHEYSGQCAPGNGSMWSNTTFSVGCYEMVPRKRDKSSSKRGPLKVRVRGLVSNSQAVYDKAEEICNQLDAGTYTGPKNVKV